MATTQLALRLKVQHPFVVATEKFNAKRSIESAYRLGSIKQVQFDVSVLRGERFRLVPKTLPLHGIA